MHSQVQGQSMKPTLNPGDGEGSDSGCGADWVLVEKLCCKWLRRYERGEVIVFW
jgi:signal peptidase I